MPLVIYVDLVVFAILCILMDFLRGDIPRQTVEHSGWYTKHAPEPIALLCPFNGPALVDHGHRTRIFRLPFHARRGARPTGGRLWHRRTALRHPARTTPPR